MSIREEVIAIVAEQLGVDKNEITPETSFVEDHQADSLDLMELVMALEEKFNVEISDQEAGNMKTVQDVLIFIDNRKASK